MRLSAARGSSARPHTHVVAHTTSSDPPRKWTSTPTSGVHATGHNHDAEGSRKQENQARHRRVLGDWCEIKLREEWREHARQSTKRQISPQHDTATAQVSGAPNPQSRIARGMKPHTQSLVARGKPHNQHPHRTRVLGYTRVYPPTTHSRRTRQAPQQHPRFYGCTPTTPNKPKPQTNPFQPQNTFPAGHHDAPRSFLSLGTVISCKARHDGSFTESMG